MWPDNGSSGGIIMCAMTFGDVILALFYAILTLFEDYQLWKMLREIWWALWFAGRRNYIMNYAIHKFSGNTLSKTMLIITVFNQHTLCIGFYWALFRLLCILFWFVGCVCRNGVCESSVIQLDVVTFLQTISRWICTLHGREGDFHYICNLNLIITHFNTNLAKQWQHCFIFFYISPTPIFTYATLWYNIFFISVRISLLFQ